MRKIFLLLAIAICSIASAQIASKSIANDSLTGCTQKIVTVAFTVDVSDTAHPVVIVECYTARFGPNGNEILPRLPYYTYTRTNKPGDMRFNALENSALGQGLKALFTNDLAPINSVNDLSKLQQ